MMIAIVRGGGGEKVMIEIISVNDENDGRPLTCNCFKMIVITSIDVNYVSIGILVA